MSHYTFYLRKSTNKNTSKASVLIRYYEDRKNRVQINTGIKISQRYWSNAKNTLKNSTDITEHYKEFCEIKMLVETIIAHYKKNNKPLSKEQFKVHFLKKSISEFDEKPVEFYNELGRYINNKKTKVVPDVIKDYNSLKKHLIGFDKNTKTITNFESINYSFYIKWTDYLANKVELKNGQIGLKNNTIGKQVKNLKAFLNNCMKLNIIPSIDLSNFKVIQEEVDHIYLNESEIKAISNVDTLNDKELTKVKDFFIIGCYTGLRFSDNIRIKPEYIDSNGFLSIRQKKTSGKIVVPLREQVLTILKKYNNYSPEISSAVFNKRIKELGKEAKINDVIEIQHKKGNTKEVEKFKKHELISSHTCRRSFCTNAYLDGIDVHLIMQISGHKTEKAFKRYLKLSSYEAALKMKEAWGI
ncbi:tyrosine-type recombinase/integrase [Olleya sp. R77988]|uniref:site-specific integrase n=1 Tax=Olleya sp. R77988 TaxID=3093875 RepID=UPI0037CC4DAC